MERRVLKKDGLLIAPNFIHDNSKKISGLFSKALSCAGVVFEAKWDAEGYKAFLEENGFKVDRSKQFASTIPLMYTECVLCFSNDEEENNEVFRNAVRYVDAL